MPFVCNVNKLNENGLIGFCSHYMLCLFAVHVVSSKSCALVAYLLYYLVDVSSFVSHRSEHRSIHSVSNIRWGWAEVTKLSRYWGYGVKQWRARGIGQEYDFWQVSHNSIKMSALNLNVISVVFFFVSSAEASDSQLGYQQKNKTHGIIPFYADKYLKWNQILLDCVIESFR